MVERHRLLWLWQGRENFLRPSDAVLHFAPEAELSRLVKPSVASYRTADLEPGADLLLNIEKIALPDACQDVVICSHVLEHVDDRKALAELLRVLRSGGRALIMVPVIEGWDATYEDAGLVTNVNRERHFGQQGHLRWYGRDVRERIIAAGFELKEFVANGPDSVRFGLLRGERVFVGTKP